MRNRFLTPIIFNQPQTSTFQTLPLPSPQTLSPSFSFDNELLRCFESLPSVSFQLESLPIDNALSKFFSDVLPHTIDTGNGVIPITHRSSASEKEADFICEERQSNSCRASNVESSDNVFSEERNKMIFAGDDVNVIQEVHFETPELNEFTEKMCITGKGNMQILMEALQNENSFETMNPTLIAPCLYEIQDLVYSIEDISSCCHEEQKLFYPEDTDLSMSEGQLSDNNFPLLEVDEISMGNLSALSLDDHLLVLLENNELANSAQNDHPEVNCLELLCSAEIGILECALDHSASKPSFELYLTSLNMPSEINILHVIETSDTEENAGCCPNSVPLPVRWQFEEFKMPDVDTFDIFEAFSICQITNGVETHDQLFQKDMNFQNFENLIVRHELAMADDAFKSFPVPVLGDNEGACLLHAIVADMLAELEPQPISASDKIYLDWHFLENDKCVCDFNAACQKKLVDMDPYIIDTELQASDGSALLLDFVLSEENLNWLNTKESELNMIFDSTCTGVSHCKMWKANHKAEEDTVQPADTDLQSVSSFDKCVSQCNDLEFFLNPRKASVGRGFDTWVETCDAKPLLHGGLSEEKIGASCSTTGLSLDIKLHPVTLSADILTLMDSFQNRYLAILEDDLKLRKREFSLAFSDDINLLSLPEEKLMECMGTSSGQESSMGYGDNNVMTFGALCAIKRMAWCLSFYGIHTLHLFMGKLLQNLECLKPRLSFLQPLVEDAHRVADREITKSHSSLALIQDILLLNSALKSKILIVADQDLWQPLKRLLNSMNISVDEVRHSAIDGNNQDASNIYLLYDNRKATSMQSDCLLASHEHISVDLLNKFDIILEYGGPCGSSKISAIYHESCGSLQLHFLKVELDGVAKALCVGVGTVLNGRFTMKLEELLDFTSIVEKCNLRSLEAVGKISSCSIPLPVHCAPIGSEAAQQIDPSFPGTVIIVNTQNFHKEMIISRRSTYQRILAMEKDGAQVVERDLDLPVDIIISAAMSLAWYDCRNIGQNATIPDEANSTTPLCIDSIAADVLTSLSFNFSSCILVFEGESKFLASIMESSDELYAAAASLGLDFQIFCSSSSEFTDEIILSCIGYATKLGKGLYPKLPESETLAESFLTRFPSINPLSAHAILSTVGMLVEFLEWSKECRVNAVQRYLVPEEAINLLSVLCRYGELEESKSGMTDCSSSVSSAPTSGHIYCKFDLGRKNQKCTWSPREAVELEPSSRHVDGVLHCPVMSKSLDLRTARKSDKRKLADLSLEHELFDQEQRPDALSKINSSLVFEPNITWASKGPQNVDYLEGSTVPLTSTIFLHKQNSSATPKIKLDWHESNIFQDLHENLMGEVIDINDKSFSDRDFSSVKTTISSPFIHGLDKELRAKDSRGAQKLFFENITYPTFLGVAEKKNDNVRTSVEDNRLCRADIGCLGVDYNSKCMKYSECLEADSTKKSATIFHGLLYKEKDTCHYGVTPLSKAISSAELQQGSPWTIEFLNRIRERSRLHKQPPSWPHDSPVACFGRSGNNMKASKRKSPSVLDYFKYQGGSTPGKLAGRKRKNQYTRPPTLSENDKSSASLLPSWTPVDKRARRTLSFAMSGTGNQTKLVWSDQDSQSLGNMKV